MKLFFDENFSVYIARGLNEFEFPEGKTTVHNTKQYFGEGIKDEDLIPMVGNENGILLTQDIRMVRTRLYVNLMIDHKMGGFFLSLPKGSKH